MYGNLTDLDLIDSIRKGGHHTDNALKQVYDKNRAMVVKFVLKNNGDREQAKDLLQDTVIIFYEQVRNNVYQHRSKISTYLYSIARYTWLNRIKRKKIETRIVDTHVVDQVDPGPLPMMLRNEQAQQIRALFESLGQDCQRILQLSFYDNYSIREICELTHYQNEQVVRNKKYKCLKELKSIVANNPNIAELLKRDGYGY